MLRKLLALLSDAAVYGASSMVTRLVGLLLVPVLTRYLSTTDYGIVMMLTIVTSLFLPLGNAGMTNAIFRRFNLEKDPAARAGVLSTGFLSVVVTSLVLLVVTMACARPISRSIVGDASAAGLVYVSLLTAAVTTVGMVPFVALRAARRVKTVALANVSKAVLSMAVTVWLVVAQGLTVWGVVIGSLVGEVTVAVALIGLTLPSLGAGFSRATWGRMASYGLPVVPHHLQAVALDLFGLYMVKEMLGLGAAALYGIATRFASPLSFVVNSVQASWVPYKFQVHAEDSDPKSFFQSTLTYYVAALSYLWVGVSLWGPDAVRLLTGGEFHDAGLLIWAVALIPVAQGLYFMSGTGLELSDNTRPMPLVSFAGLVTVVICAFALVEPLGPLGAALATTFGWLTMGALLYVFSQRRIALSYDWPTIAWFAVVAAAFVAVGGIVQSMPLVPRLAANTLLSLAYPLAGLVFLLRSRDERGRMLRLLSKFPALSNR